MSTKVVKFVIQRHNAEKAGLHDDLRIELERNKLYSWAIPKLIPLKPGIKRLAIETEVHDISWYNFEGMISDGYGKGYMKIFDRGKATILKYEPNRVLIISLQGNKRKVSGIYILIKLYPHKKSDKSWLIWKRPSV